ncbi:MAG TPA: hypothetical protein VM364_15330 [Vicinamibacterales bacterium]|nr:hypothetical protein [Vicinamibacterales bacterium]
MKKDDTSEYSSSKAPETREFAEERDPHVDPRLIPGGAEPRSPTQQGMAGLDRDAVPNGATDSGQTRYRDTSKDEVTGE